MSTRLIILAPAVLYREAWRALLISQPDIAVVGAMVDADSLATVCYTIERLKYPDGQPEVVATNAFWPALSPDGSAVGEGPAQPTLFDQWFGVQTVYAEPLAHGVPSDWWRISVAGGAPTRLSRIYDSGLFGDYAPDGQHIAFISATGVYVMSPEGGSVNPLAGLHAFGSVEWIP